MRPFGSSRPSAEVEPTPRVTAPGGSEFAGNAGASERTPIPIATSASGTQRPAPVSQLLMGWRCNEERLPEFHSSGGWILVSAERRLPVWLRPAGARQPPRPRPAGRGRRRPPPAATGDRRRRAGDSSPPRYGQDCRLVARTEFAAP